MRIGVCHVVTLPGEWEDAIAQAGDLGFDGIELFARYPTVLSNLLDHPERVEPLRKAAEHAGIAIPSLAVTGFAPGFLLGDADAALREATIERMRIAIQRTAELGAHVLMIPTAPLVENTRAVKAWVQSIKELEPTAARFEVVLGLETNYDTPTQLDIITRIASPWVEDYFDTGNVLKWGRDPVVELAARRGHVVQMHVKGPSGLGLDSGTVDLDGLKRTIQDIGFDGWIMLETSADATPLETAKRNLDILRQYFG